MVQPVRQAGPGRGFRLVSSREISIIPDRTSGYGSHHGDSDMVVFGVGLLFALFALREATSARIRAEEGETVLARQWRVARSWQDLAIVVAVIALLPTVISRPQVPILEEAHRLLSIAWPIVLAAALVGAAISVRQMTPEIRRVLEERRQEMLRRARAKDGENTKSTPISLQEWLQQHGPDYEYQFDVKTPRGHANIVIATGEGRYAIYMLPEEHFKRGFAHAVVRCSTIAEALGAKGMIWVSDATQEEVRQSAKYRVFVVLGSLSRILKLIQSLDEKIKKQRERKEERKRRQMEKSQQRTHWGSIDARRAMERHDRQGWERFARKAPIHPEMRDMVYRRSGGKCAICNMHIDPNTAWEAMVTDYDHECRHPHTIHLVPHGIAYTERHAMPDCTDCHYENPELFESCIERLASVHPRCRETKSKADEAPAATPPEVEM